MTISTNYNFNQAVRHMNELQTSISKTQTQMATGQQLTKPSDDPVKVTAIGRINSALARQASYSATLTTVEERLTATETSVKSASDIMTRVKELAIQANNSTLSNSDRANIGDEIATLRDSLVSLANSRDVDGSYLFSGTKVDQTPFGQSGNGSVEYLGDQTRTKVKLGDQQEIVANNPGTDVFSGITRNNQGSTQKVGFFQVLDDLIQSVRSSSQAGMQQGLGEVDQANNGLTHALSRIGANLNTVDAQKSLVDDTTLRLKTTLSSLADSDYAQTITNLQKESLGLQAVQSSFAKTADLNLFNYLK